METNVIYNEECLQGMKRRIPDNSIDMILCDLPYGITQNSWDEVIPFSALWGQYERIIKSNGAIVLTSDGIFTTKLISSNLDIFRYRLVWDKISTTGFLNANRMPLRRHEDICIFYKHLPTYNPKMRKGKMRIKGGSKTDNGVYGNFKSEQKENDRYYPTSIIRISNADQRNKIHPNQKPVELFEWLIKTYTNEGDVVLDNCIGSGTTAVACLKTNRKFIGFELEEKYYHIALKRIGKFDKSYYNELPEEEKPAKVQLF